MKSVFRFTRMNIGLIVLAMMVVVVLLSAGCSSQKSESAAPAAGSPQGAASVSPAGTAATAAPVAGGSCFILNGKGAWDGKWKGKIMGRRADLRECFYPPTQDRPDPWESCGWSPLEVDIEFSQTGCDVNGKMTATNYDIQACPVTVTGKAVATSVQGTWKAYCDLGGAALGVTDESGSFSLWMDPAGVSFIGALDGSSPANVEATKDAVAEGLNSNFAGKRA